MSPSRTRTCITALAAFALIAVLLGALVTDSRIAASQASDIWSVPHRISGLACIGLAIGLAVLVKQPTLRPFAFLAAATALLDGLLGFTSLTTGTAILHACLGHLLFATVVALAFLARKQQPVPLDTVRFPQQLASIAPWLPIAVFAQITMGAMYRHKFWGVLPHMAGALVAALLLLGVSVFVLQTLPDHRALHPAAIAVLSVTLLQVSLGVAVFVMGLLDFDNTLIARISAAAHVTNGSLTLAAGLVFAIQLRRSAAPIPT